MKKPERMLLLFLCIAAGGCSSLRPSRSAIHPKLHVVEHERGICHLCDLYHHKRTVLVRILTAEGECTGIVVSGKGDILTLAGRIMGAGRIIIETHDRKHLPARILRCDKDRDLAQLKAAASGADWTPLSLERKRVPVVGDLVYAIGHSDGLGWTVTEGTMSDYRRAGEVGTTPMIETSAAVYSGNGGGVLVDRLGRFVGLLSSRATTPDKQTIAFGIPISVLASFVR